MAPSRLLANVTLALAALASLLLQIALVDRQPIVWPGWVQLGIAALIAAGVACWSARFPWIKVSGFGFLALLPLLGNALSRSFLHVGDPNEVLLAYTLRNLMLGLAATRSESRTQHFAGFASFFIVLFSFLWTMNPTTIVLLIGYALVGMWWLLGCYWDGIQGRFADKTEQAIPLKPAMTAIGIVLLLVLAALPIASSSRVTTALQGFFPSSGGNRWSDEFAQGGVGDGDQMVAAKDNATGFGAVESELFLESKMPSLYDVVNELGQPSKKKKKKGRQRAIPLAPSAMKESHRRLGQNQRANREFDTLRTRPTYRPKQSEDYESPSLLQVRGRVPLHLGLYAYDTWDGRSLGSSDAGGGVFLKLDRDPVYSKNWLRLSRIFPEPLFNHTDQHQVRVLNLKTERIPAPPNLTAVNLDGLHTTGLFCFTPDSCLRLDSTTIPQLTVFNVESRRLPQHAEPELRFSASAGQDTAQANRVAQLARAWTSGVKPGWQQVMAIRDRLRAEYTLDLAAVAPEDCDDTVEHFLFEAKRGPNYLFATSAALLVRSLGYEARVRSGFYARPKNYDRLADLTSIYKEDAHFWIEVFVEEGTWFDSDSEQRFGSWLAVDPSPGYEVLHAPETLFTRWAKSVASAVHLVAAHPIASSLWATLIAVAFWFRVPLLDGAITTWWGVTSRARDPRRGVLATVRLLERRAWLRRKARAPGTTIGRWQLHAAATPPEAATALREFQRLASWAIYGEGAPATLPADRIRASCRQAARLALRTKH